MALFTTTLLVMAVLAAMSALLWLSAVVEARQLGPTTAPAQVGGTDTVPAELNPVQQAA